MKNKNVLVGIAAGAALLSVAIYLTRNSRYNWRSISSSAEDAIDSIKSKVSGNTDGETSGTISDSPGQHLANKARHKAEHHMAMSKNGHH